MHVPHPATRLAVAVAAALLLLATTVHSIGVNYGTMADNLPPPAQVAQFLRDRMSIDRIKLFDANPDILRAFANTGILVAVTVPNGEIPALTDAKTARRWITDHIKPFYPDTHINYILLGNEILHWGPQPLIDNLVAAMRSLHNALAAEGISDIAVTTAHSLGILEPSDLPSLARFRPGWDQGVLAPMLEYHRETKTPFMVNPYPYFMYSPEKADMALFRPNNGLFDPYTKRTYGNLFDFLLDSVYIAMKKLGYGDVEIVVGETGWASEGEVFEKPKCSVPNAAAYNGGLVDHFNSGRGTPLMPRRRFMIYIFALFNENQKEGSLAEKNFGLFRPDFTPVYDIGLMKQGGGGAPATPATPAPSKSTPPPVPAPPVPVQSPPVPVRAPVPSPPVPMQAPPVPVWAPMPAPPVPAKAPVSVSPVPMKEPVPARSAPGKAPVQAPPVPVPATAISKTESSVTSAAKPASSVVAAIVKIICAHIILTFLHSSVS